MPDLVALRTTRDTGPALPNMFALAVLLIMVSQVLLSTLVALSERVYFLGMGASYCLLGETNMKFTTIGGQSD